MTVRGSFVLGRRTHHGSYMAPESTYLHLLGSIFERVRPCLGSFAVMAYSFHFRVIDLTMLPEMFKTGDMIL